MAFRTQIPGNLVGDDEITRDDLVDPLRHRVEGVQYPIDEDLTIENGQILVRTQELIIQPGACIIVEAGGQIVIRG